MIGTFAALAVALTASAAVAVTTDGARQCADPCIEAARGVRRACVASAAGAFTDALGGCLAREPECLAACGDERQDCRDATNLGPDLAACRIALALARERCRNDFRPGSIRRAICIDRARLRELRCRTRAVVRARHDVRACRTAFAECAGACAAGGPPGGSEECRAQARSAFAAARAACRTAFRTTTGGCLARDITCVQECVAARDGCDAAAAAALDQAVASCRGSRDAGIAACRAAHPDGGSGLRDCEEAVRAAAFACRQAALAAAAPAFTACAGAYVRCVRGCPR